MHPCLRVLVLSLPLFGRLFLQCLFPTNDLPVKVTLATALNITIFFLPPQAIPSELYFFSFSCLWLSNTTRGIQHEVRDFFFSFSIYFVRHYEQGLGTWRCHRNPLLSGRKEAKLSCQVVSFPGKPSKWILVPWKGTALLTRTGVESVGTDSHRNLALLLMSHTTLGIYSSSKLPLASFRKWG